VIGRARAALLILEHAQRLGLPMPFSVETTDHTLRITLMFRSVADLAQWALWLEVPVGEEQHPEFVHHIALADALDQPVRLVRVEGAL
jgi:hypothetical protein